MWGIGKTARQKNGKERPAAGQGITGRMALASARRPWLVIGLWAGLLVAGGMLASGVGDVLTTEMSMSDKPESAKADRLIEERMGRDETATEIVIVSSDTMSAQDERFRSFVGGLSEDIRSLPTTASAASFYDAEHANMVSDDGHSVLVSVELTGEPAVAEENVGPLLEVVGEANLEPGFQVLTAGEGSISRTFSETSEQDLMRGEMITIPIALLILLVVFGAAVAAGIPLAVAVLAIVVAVGTTAVIGRVYELSFFVVNMITMIGMAVGVDYSLFIVQRYREERGHGGSVNDAIGQAGATASRAVLFSGGTVVIGLASLLIVPSTVYRSLAVGAVAVAAISVIAALTVLPALLSVLGDRIDSFRLPFGRRGSNNTRAGLWDRVTALVMRRPVVSTTAAVALLLAAAVPAFTMSQGTAGVSSLPAGTEPRTAFEVLDEEFSAGMITPAQIVIDAPLLNAVPVRGAISDLLGRLEQDPSFGEAMVEQDPSESLAIVSVPIEGDPHSAAAHDSLKRLRGEHIPTAFTDVDADVLVTGKTASAEDEFATIRQYTPIVFAFVLALSFVLLLIVFRSIVVPAKAIIMNLLSVGAAYGLLVLVFQHGVGSSLLGFQRTETIEAWLPLFLFAVLFGLSMDYHVFLVSRIKERFDQTGDNTASVAYGTRQTASIITGAAAIMVAVFAGFATGNLASMQQMGFGLAVAVILDATVIRSILVPASMQLLGEWNWYFPSWLSWVPRLEVEGDSGRYRIGDSVPIGAGGR
jgi:RND superfamily putative drug exporter